MAAAVAMMVVVAGCGSDDETASTDASETTDAPSTTGPATTAAPATTLAPSTTEPTTTAAPATTTAAATTEPGTTDAPTTTEPAPTTTGEPVTGGFDPPCVEQEPTGRALPEVDPELLGSFGPLAASPALDVALPAVRSPFHPELALPVADAEWIDGDVLVAVRGPEGEPFAASMLAAIDVDGTVRWVRCLDETVAAIAAGGTRALVRTRTATSPTVAWLQVTLDTGEIEPASLHANGEGWSPYPLAAADTSMLFGPPWDAALDPAVHRLARFDLADWTEEQSVIHHIRDWEHFGTTDMAKMIPLCPKHHHTAHEGGRQLSLDPTTRALTITYPDGTTHTSAAPRARAPAA